MASIPIILLVIAGLAGIVFLIIRAVGAAAERERRRLAGLAGWAALNAFEFHPRDPWNLDDRYRGIGDIGRGHDRYALEVLSRQDPVPAALFRYHYKTWETRTVTDSKGNTRTQTYEETHWRRYLVMELGGNWPQFAIRPEGFFDRVAGFLGFDDIDFESEEFSIRYHCKSADKQFAYALIHPTMMEWMLRSELPFAGELNGGRLVMDGSSAHHSAEQGQTEWSRAAGFLNRIPPFVWHDHGRREPVRLPETRPYVAPPPAPPRSARDGEAVPATGVEKTP